MGVITFQLTGNSTVFATSFRLGNHQTKTEKLRITGPFIREIYRWLVNSSYKGPVMRKLPWRHRVMFCCLTDQSIIKTNICLFNQNHNEKFDKFLEICIWIHSIFYFFQVARSVIVVPTVLVKTALVAKLRVGSLIEAYSDAIWRHRSRSALAQVMACCPTAPSHYLNQCWLFISEILRRSSESNCTASAQGTIKYMSLKIMFLKFCSISQGP